MSEKPEKKQNNQEESAEQDQEITQDVVESNEQTQTDWEDKFYRAQAEMQNMQSRNAKERADFEKFASQSLIKDLLPTIDNLERALEVEVTDDNAEKLKSGVQMVYDNLKNILGSHNVESFGEISEEFNPEIHQAVATVPLEKNQKENTIALVMQRGYKLHDRIIRPAIVSVYGGK